MWFFRFLFGVFGMLLFAGSMSSFGAGFAWFKVIAAIIGAAIAYWAFVAD